MRIRYWSSDVCSSDLAEEEARLAVLGCHILLEPGDGPALIFDIGGGSTELVLVDTEGPAPHILDWQSAPGGVVSLTESEPFGPGDAEARIAGYARMRERETESFRPFAERQLGRAPWRARVRMDVLVQVVGEHCKNQIPNITRSYTH